MKGRSNSTRCTPFHGLSRSRGMAWVHIFDGDEISKTVMNALREGANCKCEWSSMDHSAELPEDGILVVSENTKHLVAGAKKPQGLEVVYVEHWHVMPAADKIAELLYKDAEITTNRLVRI